MSQHNTPFTSLIAEYPTVFQPHLSDHTVECYSSHLHWWTPCYRTTTQIASRKTICGMLRIWTYVMMEQGIIRPSSSQWSSPLHMVTKKSSGDWWPCGNYTALNRATIPDRYSIPCIQDFLVTLHGPTVFSKLDPVCAYYQIRVAPEDIPMTAITTPFSLFKFLRMPSLDLKMQLNPFNVL